MKRPAWTYGFFYQRWSRLLHRFNLHQTREIGPMEDGATITKCDWCGLSQRRGPRRFPASTDPNRSNLPALWRAIDEFAESIEWPRCPNVHSQSGAWIEGRDAARKAFIRALFEFDPKEPENDRG